MNDEMYVVIVDTRGMSPSHIDGYEETTCSAKFFDEHVLVNPKVRCVKIKVAELCGIEMKVYFHEHTPGHVRHIEETPEEGIKHAMDDLLHPLGRTNGAATYLTFDPRTGCPEFKIRGKAYVVVDGGDYPVSNHQVWGIQELIREAYAVYHCDPEQDTRGLRDLVRWCKQYRHQEYGPLTIYIPRESKKDDLENSSVETVYAHGRKCHYCHHKDCACSKCKDRQTCRHCSTPKGKTVSQKKRLFGQHVKLN
jgi:hypothetical protein